jgi:hypothetical protein
MCGDNCQCKCCDNGKECCTSGKCQEENGCCAKNECGSCESSVKKVEEEVESSEPKPE